MVTTVLLTATFAHAECVGPESLASKLRVQRDVNTELELGAWFDRHQQYACAVQSYRSALALSPSSSRILELLGASLASSGDLNAAADALQQSIRLAPSHLTPHFRLATVLEQLRREDEAKAQWKQALQIDSQSQAALEGLSQHLIAEGDYAGAIALLHGAKLNEKLTLSLAQAYGKAGAYKEAEELLSASLRKSPSSYVFVNALATVYVNEGLRENALATARTFAASHPKDMNAQTLLLRLLLLTNQTSQAAPLAHKLLASVPRDPYLLYICGTLERQAGEFQPAREHLQLAVALQPDVYQSRYGLGVVLLRLNELQGAKEQLEKAISLGGSDPEAHLELGTVLKKLGDTAAAERELQLYREASRQHSNTTIAESKAISAQQQLGSGDPQKAVELYREALQAAPGDALLHYKLSAALDRLGDTAGERNALEKAVQIDPDMAAAHNQLGYLASRGGDLTAAEKHFREAVRAAPLFTEAWINLAATLGMESKVAEAQQAVDAALKLDPSNFQALQLRRELTGSPQSALAIGLELYKKRDYAKARPQFESALNDRPNDVRVAILLADTDLHLNAAADAVTLLEPLAASNLQNSDFELIYGTALIAMGRQREGLPHVEKVAESNQNAEAYMIAGQALLAFEEFDQARKDFEAALRINPGLPGIQTQVGIARDKVGDTANAENAFRDALKINADDFQANLYLGAILSQRRELSEAKPYLDRALKLDPNDSMARYESAMLKNASGEYEAATAELEQLANAEPEWLEPHIALATLYYKVHRPEDGARERQTVDRITAEQQARGTKAR